MPEFMEIQRKLIDTLLLLPVTNTYGGRSILIDGLPQIGLNRSENMARLDLTNVISGLHRLGRLTKQGGIRPLMVVIDNALLFADGEVADTLNTLKRELEQFYGDDIQPVLDPAIVTPEALIFGEQRDTRLPFGFIQGALRIGRSITRLYVPRIFDGKLSANGMVGTGWLLAPGIIITNHHVINARNLKTELPAKSIDFQAQAEHLIAWFDYYEQEDDTTHLECKGASLLASNKQLDYAILQLTETDKVADRVPLQIIANQPQLIRGARLNIAQHPSGGVLRYAIRNNFYVQSASANLIHYQTDTEPGASGSPVCDDNWQVVALHHASTRTSSFQQVPQEVVDGNPVAVRVLNEAITIHAILNDLPTELRQKIMQI